jgi:gliding motility-associated-like protein
MKNKYFLAVFAFLTTFVGFSQGPSEAPDVFVEIQPPTAVCFPGDCTTLSATYSVASPTTDYTVSSIIYQPLFSFNDPSATQIPIPTTGNQDDFWAAGVFALPFPFCFYNINYNNLLVGSNGVLKFGPLTELDALKGNFCPFNLNDVLIPNGNFPTAGNKVLNAIYGIYQDIDFQSGIGSINYKIFDSFPNRTFVMNVSGVPQWPAGQNTNNLQTTQIILYETTNIIDILVKRRVLGVGNSSWREGVLGIQNATGTLAETPPERNTGFWTVEETPASPSEAWRFTPSGAGTETVTFIWRNQANDIILQGSGAAFSSVQVCPLANETYSVEAIFTRCDGSTVSVSDTYLLQIEPPLDVVDPLDLSICNDTYPASVNINQDTHILDAAQPSDYEILYFINLIDAQNQVDSQQIPTLGQVTNLSIPDGNPIVIYALIRSAFGGICTNIRPFTVQVGISKGDFTYPEDASDTDVTTSTFCFNSDSALAPVLDPTDGLTADGTFTVDPPTGLIINETTGVLNLTGAIPGTYIINYDIPEDPSNPPPVGCPDFNANTVVIIESCIDAMVGNSGPICEGNPTFDLTTTYTEPAGGTTTYEWTNEAGTVVSTLQNPIDIAVPATQGTYIYSLVITQNGAASEPFETPLIVHPLPGITNFGTTTTICTNETTTLVFTGTPGALVDFSDGANNYSVTLDGTGNQEFITPPLANNTTFTLDRVTGTTTPACLVELNVSVLITVGLPTASIVGAGFTNSICSETSTGLQIQGTPNAVVSYTKAGVAQPDVTLSAAGTFTIDTGVQTVTSTTTYTYVLTNVASATCSDSITGQSAVLTVNALPNISSFEPEPVSGIICEGTSATLKFVGTPNATVIFNDGTQELSVLLDAIGNATYTSGPIFATTTFTLERVEATTNAQLCLQLFTAQVLITVSPNVSIIDPPIQGGTICPGTSKTFTVNATGLGLEYNWYKVGTIIPIATTSTNSFTITSPVASDAGVYFATVSGTCGAIQTSVNATLIISQATAITTQPQPQIVCAGQQIDLNIEATGNGNALTYKWFKGTTLLSTQTSSPLAIPSATAADAGTYNVVITNSCGVETFSNSVQVTVNESPTVTNPVSASICEGEGIALSVTATGTNISFQWFRNGNILTGFISATYSDASVSLAEAGNYTVTVTGTCGLPADSQEAVIVVNQGPTFIDNPQGGTFCSGNPITILNVETTGGTNVAYQWIKDGTAIVGATAPNYPINASVVADSGSYFCQVTSDSCDFISSVVAVILVNQGPAIVNQTGSEEICAGEIAEFTVTATGTNLVYQWFKGTTAINGATSNTFSIPNASETDSNFYYCRISSASCLDINTIPVTLVVKPLPIASIIQETPSTICEGESTQVRFSGTPGVVVIYTINGGTPETITLNTSGVYTFLSTGILDETTVYELVSVTYQGPNACSQNLTGSATITVNPLPTVTIEDGFICIDPITSAVTRVYKLDTQLNEADFTFEWFDTNGAIPFETKSFYEAQAVGQYGVTITDIITGCESPAFANVDSSSPPTDFTYEVNGFFADNPTVVITAIPIGDYEYQLNYGPFQSSNVFDNIAAGPHTISVRDPEACDILTKEVLIIDFPKYFTPNGDGINDTWTIPSITSMSSTKIHIFDRFGKLIKEMTASGIGWDGTYNGQLLPATDYWFTINYQEAGINKEFRSHFAMKR